ncbi:phage GP46 family protein [Roseomonas elaeocarpi]|uniref:Phage GP46 family protein n=1 Tax=Roseomonas elaeocarpi TaxID=907779 RepID=A0ABV6JQC1_9PROT
MTDIAIAWDTATGQGDWSFEAGDLAVDSGLRSAVLVSLFTDRRAAEDFVPTDGTSDRRGWWGDTYEADQIGSRLWQYERAKKADGTALLRQVRDSCSEALAWLVEDGVAAKVDVTAAWLNRTTIGLGITISEPDGKLSTFNFSWAWSGI